MSNDNEQRQELLELYLMLAFEAGRAYENNYILAKAYETINVDDFVDAIAKGAGIDLSRANQDSMLNILGDKDIKKINALVEKRKNFENIIEQAKRCVLCQ